MEVVYGFPPLTSKGNFIALGNFDGVHIGHKEIIGTMVSEAKKTGAKSCVVTFRNHPRQLLRPNEQIRLLTPLSVKIKLISRLGVDMLVLLDFTRDFAKARPIDFVRDYVVDRFNSSRVYVGYNYSFGYQGTGTPYLLEELGKRFGFTVIVMPPVHIDGVPVSSTYIRRLLEEGKIEEAHRYLGHWPMFAGEVVHGDGLGRTLGYPTANLLVGDEVQLPRPGVYYGAAEVDDNTYKAVINIGLRPTVSGRDLTFEVHLLDFRGSLYGRELTCCLKKRLRDEKKFSNIDELCRQISRDVALAAGFKE